MSQWRPLKRFCRGAPQYGLNVAADRYVGGGIRLMRTTDVTASQSASASEGVYLEASQVPAEYLLADGDLLFSRSGSIGRCLRYSSGAEPSTFAGYLVRFKPLSKITSRYLEYCAQTSFFQDTVNVEAVTSTISNLNAERYGNVMLPWRSIESQRAIADFLDAETAHIDALIAKKELMATLLRERASMTLDEALRRRGVLQMDESRHPVQLPVGWVPLNLGRVLRQLTNGYVGPTRDILVDDGIRYIQGTHIKSGRIEFARRPFYVSPEWHLRRPRISLKQGDLVIVQTGDIGQVAVVPANFGEASCHALLIARPNPDIVSSDYLGLYLQSTFGRQQLLRLATGACILIWSLGSARLWSSCHHVLTRL